MGAEVLGPLCQNNQSRSVKSGCGSPAAEDPASVGLKGVQAADLRNYFLYHLFAKVAYAQGAKFIQTKDRRVKTGFISPARPSGRPPAPVLPTQE